MKNDEILRNQMVELLRGGFAPNITLLREFTAEKAGIILDGLHFSAWILLGHIHARHNVLLDFIKDPENHQNVWPDAFWPENRENISEEEWNYRITGFENDLGEFIIHIQDPATSLFKVYNNGKTVSWAALTAIHHTGYHIGQVKAIGRQLGVW